MTRGWAEVTRGEPCGICGKPDYCSVSLDGAWAICRRVQAEGGTQRTDRSGGDYWLYRRAGNQPSYRPARPLPSPPAKEPSLADPTARDAVYRTLLNCLPLSRVHQDNLRARGLDDAAIRMGGYGSLILQGRAAIAGRLAARFGENTVAMIPGFIRREETGRSWWALAGSPGLIVPVRDLEGRIVALKVRLDAPGDGPKYGMVSSRRHGGPGPGSPCHVPIFGARGDTIRISEGEIKADVASHLGGLLTLSLPGVSGWKAILPLLGTFKPTIILIAFDSDWQRNITVARCLMACAIALDRAGYRVLVEVWDPAYGKGVDHLLSAGHAPEPLDMAAAIDALPKTAFKPGYVGHFLGPREQWCGIPRDLVVEKATVNG